MSDTPSPTATLARIDLTAYHAALEACVYYSQAGNDLIWMRDRDRAALLHRLSTNAIDSLQPGQGTMTVLTTPIGRIMDLLEVYCLDDALLLVPSAGNTAAVVRHLQKNIFFNDRVKVAAAGDAFSQIRIYGPQAAAALADLGLPGADLPLHAVATSGTAEDPVYIAAVRPIGGAGFAIIAAPDSLRTLMTRLQERQVPALDHATYTTLYVEQGYPIFGHELSLDYIPLETGLWDAVSFHKGCYVGQEIIARMESRGRLAKQLRGLRFAGGPFPQPPAPLEVAGKEAGTLTSLVNSPRFGPIGLAYVRTAHAEPGTVIDFPDTQAVVIALPFA
jgi:folate-binding protein YgfZ